LEALHKTYDLARDTPKGRKAAQEAEATLQSDYGLEMIGPYVEGALCYMHIMERLYSNLGFVAAVMEFRGDESGKKAEMANTPTLRVEAVRKTVPLARDPIDNDATLKRVAVKGPSSPTVPRTPRPTLGVSKDWLLK
jgi:hypothetical protein